MEATPGFRILALRDAPAKLEHWDKFVKPHPEGTIFHLWAWQSLIESSFGHMPCHLIAEDTHTEEIVGILPLFLVRSLIFGRMLISTPQAAYGGILTRFPEVAAALQHRAEEDAHELKVQFLEIRNFRNASTDPTLLTKDLYVTFRQELFANPEQNMQAIPRKTRAEIREGLRNSLEFGVNAIGVDEFYQIYSQSVRELGTPVFPKELFRNGLKEFGEECKIFSVQWKGKPVAAVWTLFYQGEVIPYYGGSLREYNRLAVNNFMYWMLIKYGCENGFRIFDFGRSKKGSGSFDFKKRWGMEMTDLPYQYRLVKQSAMPDLSPMNPKFSLGIRLWRQLPLPVTNLVGPLLSRHLT